MRKRKDKSLGRIFLLSTELSVCRLLLQFSLHIKIANNISSKICWISFNIKLVFKDKRFWCELNISKSFFKFTSSPFCKYAFEFEYILKWNGYLNLIFSNALERFTFSFPRFFSPIFFFLSFKAYHYPIATHGQTTTEVHSH